MTRARDLLAERPCLDVLLYGLPGTGKTVRGARAPMPFIALTEPQGLPIIAATNPNADVEVIRTAPEFFELMAALKAGVEEEVDGQRVYEFDFRGERRRCQTVVLDSATDLGERVLVYLTKETDVAGTIDWTKLDPKSDDSYGWGVWGKYSNWMGAAFHDLRSLPVHVLVLVLAEEKNEDVGADKQRRVIRPALFGKLRTMAAQWFGLVGYCERTVRGAYVVRWGLPEPYITKCLPGLPAVTVDDLETPGKTTLGSIALAVLGDQVPHAEGDDASLVGPPEEPETEPKTPQKAAGGRKPARKRGGKR